MTSDTIPNVLRELLLTVLDPVCTEDWAPACKELRRLLSAPSPAGCKTCHDQGEIWTGQNAYQGHLQPPEPIMDVCPECSGESVSPAGVDGLELVAWQHWGDRTKLLCALGKERCIPGSYTDEFTQPLCRLSEAQAIIDGLRGEVAQLGNELAETELRALKFYHQIGAHVDLYRELRTERDQQAQRIGELEGLLYEASGELRTDRHHGLRPRIDAALSAGKEGE